MDEFSTWLYNKINESGMSVREFGRRAGLTHTTMYEVLNNNRKPTFEFCAAIARPLGMEPEDVMRRAGLLPSYRADDAKLKTIYQVMRQLSPEEQDNLISYARWRLAEQRARETNRDEHPDE